MGHFGSLYGPGVDSDRALHTRGEQRFNFSAGLVHVGG